VVRELNDQLYFNTFQLGLDELLRYADRNAMAHGREVRLPYLNHELVSFVFSLPETLKIGQGHTKWILRKAISGRLPDEITWKRRKTGFEPPQKEWMQHPLLVDQLNESKKRLVGRGILNKSVLDKGAVGHDAYAKNSAEWRWLITGMFQA
jgi:asparagine synthase (glutamine-hydrolysing)